MSQTIGAPPTITHSPSMDEIWAWRHQMSCNTYSTHVAQFGTAQKDTVNSNFQMSDKDLVQHEANLFQDHKKGVWH